MPLLHLLSYAAIVAAFAFMTLSLASGLLYISELIEEHSKLAKIIGQRGIYTVIFLHILLYFFDSLPLSHILFSITCHFIYLQNFSSSWPLISLTSISFIASCILAISDHFIWFFYFASTTKDARQTSRNRDPRSKPPPGFMDIATFFGVCVWLVPLFLFLSLSANDNALPMSSGATSTPSKSLATPVQRSSLFKSLFSILPLNAISLRSSRKDTSEGIIAPRSPGLLHRNGSPVPPSPTPMRSYSNPPYPTSPGGSPSRGPKPDDLLSPNGFYLSSPPPRRSQETPRRVTVGDRASFALRRNSSTGAHSFNINDYR